MIGYPHQAWADVHRQLREGYQRQEEMRRRSEKAMAEAADLLRAHSPDGPKGHVIDAEFEDVTDRRALPGPGT